jgi:hypothetical protein
MLCLVAWARTMSSTKPTLPQAHARPSSPDIQGSIIGTLDSSSGTPSKRGYLPYGVSASAPGSFAYTAQRIDPETNRTVRRDTIRKGIFLSHDTPSSARRQGASQCN